MRAGWAVCLVLLAVAGVWPCLARERYRYLSYAEINAGMIGLARKNGNLLRVFSAQQEFGLPYAGQCHGGRTQKEIVPCQVLIAELGARPIEPTRPQILIMGSIHGDERLGAQIAFHVVKSMVVKYKTDPWIQRLVNTRRIVVVPMPNPAGYDRWMRYEEVEGELVDPNADFPIDQRDARSCMRSVAARTINELFQSSVFRIALIFHSKRGPFIGYSWGGAERCSYPSTNETMPAGVDQERHCVGNYTTPDEMALRHLAQHMSTFAGDLEDTPYLVGSLNDPALDSTYPSSLVDWAYAASWTHNVTTCMPTTYGGYPSHKTQYNDVTNRCLSYVVETSKDSSPSEKELGEPRGLYTRKAEHGNGHIPRNLRLSLMAIDLASPYIFFLTSPGVRVDLTRGGVLRLKWSVGGGFSVSETYIEFEVEKTREKFTTHPQSGGSMWAQNHGVEGYEKRFHLTDGIMYRFTYGTSVKWAYSEQIRLLNYINADVQKTGSDLRIRAVAKVDHAWAEEAEGFDEYMEPDGKTSMTRNFRAQSHLARARADALWQSNSGGYEVRGSDYIYSEVITMRLPPRSLRNSFYGYVAEMVLAALMVCILPPAVLAICWRKMSAPSAYVKRNFRRALRTFSQRDIAEEIARLRDQRKGSKLEQRRNAL